MKVNFRHKKLDKVKKKREKIFPLKLYFLIHSNFAFTIFLAFEKSCSLPSDCKIYQNIGCLKVKIKKSKELILHFQ